MKRSYSLFADKTVYSLEELRDIKPYAIGKLYEGGGLTAWLYDQGYSSLADSISDITEKTPSKFLPELSDILKLNYSANAIKEAAYQLVGEERYLKQSSAIAGIKNKGKRYAENRHRRFDELLANLSNAKELSQSKAVISELTSDFSWEFNYAHRKVFWDLVERENYISLMALLINFQTRKYYLRDWGEKEEDVSSDKNATDDYLWFNFREGKKILNNLCRKGIVKVFCDSTDGLWKEVQNKGTKYMVLWGSEGSFVRSHGNKEEKLSSGDMNGYFVVLDGLEVNSNSETNCIFYMEV